MQGLEYEFFRARFNLFLSLNMRVDVEQADSRRFQCRLNRLLLVHDQQMNLYL